MAVYFCSLTTFSKETHPKLSVHRRFFRHVCRHKKHKQGNITQMKLQAIPNHKPFFCLATFALIDRNRMISWTLQITQFRSIRYAYRSEARLWARPFGPWPYGPSPLGPGPLGPGPLGPPIDKLRLSIRIGLVNSGSSDR